MPGGRLRLAVGGRRDLAGRQAGVQMARDPVIVAGMEKRRVFDQAAIEAQWTARREAATPGQVDGRTDFALQDDLLDLGVRVWFGHGREQRNRVRVLGLLKK